MDEKTQLENISNSDSDTGVGNQEESSHVWATINILSENPEYPGQKNNEVRTSRYTIWSFIPLTLLENFRILSNIYFLLICIISFLPWSPVGWLFQLLPLIFVIVVSMIKAGIEDYMKKREDNIRNSQKTFVYRDGQWTTIKAKEVVVGDIIKITEDSMVPSDILYIGSSQEDKLAYYNETNLNGESAVKTINCFPLFQDCDPLSEFTNKQFTVEIGEPDRDLTRFDARLKCGTNFWAINIHNVLLRGMCTNYTQDVLGVVLRTGHDSKIMKNMNHPSAKLTSFDHNLNRMLLAIFCIKVIICIISAGVGCALEVKSSFSIISETLPSQGASFGQYFIQFFLLYSYLIPISLTVTIEILRLFHKILVDRDPTIYDPEFGTATAHNSSQIGQLGLITHVLSDKTGTLTENKMELLKFCNETGKHLANEFLGQIKNDHETIKPMLPFLFAMAACNNVIVFKKSNGEIEYNADSPDEAAFVNYAAECGVKLIERGLTTAKFDILGVEKTYEIISTFPFNSDRKRMSILIRTKGEDAILLCKGADNIIFERSNKELYEEEINDFAVEGLRTLVFSQRIIPDDFLVPWLEEHRAAEASLANRDDLVAQSSAKIECNLDIIGVTGIEDRLQPQVPETIKWLRKAGIGFWVLTGDKLETAIAIGRTSGIIYPDSDVLTISNPDESTIRRKLKQLSEDSDTYNLPVLIVTADSVNICLNECINEFMEASSKMSSVILSRVSPFMKAQVVQTVSSQGAITLAIGDGANDVCMIQEAHVGVGVAGREGSQAAQSADFAIPRFRFLIRLLTAHGHWSYYRFSYVAMIMLWKNFAFIFAQFWFSFSSMFTPTTYYEDFFLSLFNLLFTMLPPFIFGGTEQDLPFETLRQNPVLYKVSHDPMKILNLLYYIVIALYQSVIAYFSVRLNQGFDSLASSGVATYYNVVYIVSVQILIWMHYYNKVSIIIWIVSLVLLPIVSSVYMAAFNAELEGIMTSYCWGKASTWLCLIISVILGVLLPSIIDFTRKRFRPSTHRIYEERVCLKSKKDDLGGLSLDDQD
ncbi:phospholipid-translocating P-type ATPase, flippase family protein [Histomonas meleagridis]|uniref:phospholipid-translocating P-type ATPase, flippase family protein n=1 Tax=Histomonas meleagridis TaxID=135588 RepID=UPI00355956EC|nr:phospholipid-translocating P-type ATPase, flippase family protein [Histomonas meleagridis]KAH0796744.1 phospholipid-translocating P-type ATPase, flippase family protein [Histomonas meleagridis]